jgi:hypothetical protein
METTTPPASVSNEALWTGRVMSAVPVLMLLFSATMKLMHPPQLDEGFAKLGWPVGLALMLGILELACTVVYLVPRTAVLGAILLTGYMGGAIATHVRIGDPVYLHIAFGVLIWGGLYLRDPRLRALIPNPDQTNSEAKAQITPKNFIIFLGMTILAVFAAKLVAVGVIDSSVRGFYEGARRSADGTYFFLTQFVSCAIAAFVFVWIGSRPVKQLRWFSVWLFAGLSIAAAIAMSGSNGALGFVGQCVGAIGAAVLFRK